MTNADLLPSLAYRFALALPIGMNLEVDGNTYVITGERGTVQHCYPDELPAELLTTLFLDSIQTAVADLQGEYWPQIGTLKLDYEVQVDGSDSVVHFFPFRRSLL